MIVRLKMTCGYKSESGREITFHCVTGHSGDEAEAAEDKRFFEATPSGQMVFYTVNGPAAAQFGLGKDYYVDITPAG